MFDSDDRIYTVCRVCGISKKAMHLITSVEAMPSQLFDCLGLMVRNNDRMPQVMCNSCISKIKEFSAFRKLAADKNQGLRKLFGLREARKTSIVTTPSPLNNWQCELFRNPKIEVIESNGKKRIASKCTVCHKKFYNLGRHMTTHSVSPLTNVCLQCGENFNSVLQYENHLKWHIDSGIPLICRNCHNEFSQLSQYKRHISTCAVNTLSVTEPDFKCPRCLVIYPTRHLYISHDCFIKFKDKCPKCNYVVKRKDLKSHVLNCKMKLSLKKAIQLLQEEIKAVKSIGKTYLQSFKSNGELIRNINLSPRVVIKSCLPRTESDESLSFEFFHEEYLECNQLSDTATEINIICNGRDSDQFIIPDNDDVNQVVYFNRDSENFYDPDEVSDNFVFMKSHLFDMRSNLARSFEMISIQDNTDFPFTDSINDLIDIILKEDDFSGIETSLSETFSFLQT